MRLPGLRRARELAGLTQTELADKLGTSQDVISKWETGRRGARPGTGQRLARVLGVPVRELAEPPASAGATPTLREFLQERVGSSYLALPEEDIRNLIGEEQDKEKVLDVVLALTDELGAFIEGQRRDSGLPLGVWEMLAARRYEVSNKWSMALNLALQTGALDHREETLRDAALRLMPDG